MTGWRLPYAPEAARWLQKADPQVARRIRDGLTVVVATGLPRSRGKALSGTLRGLWRYRIGNWSVIRDIGDDQLIVLALEADHWPNTYD